MTDIETFYLPVSYYEKLARKNPEQLIYMIQKISKVVEIHELRIQIGLTSSAFDRVKQNLFILKEELGVTAQPQDLILCGQRSFQFSAVFHGKPFKDNQVSNVYLLWLDRDAEEFTLQKEEISAVRWMPLADCLRDVENGALNSCIFPEELRMVQAAVEKADKT